MPIKRTLSLSLVAIWFCAVGVSEASLIITDVTFASNQISLKVTGTVEAGDINGTDLDSLFFGFDNGGDASWITSVDGVASSALDVKNGGSYTVSNTGTNDLNGFNTFGGYLYTNSFSLIEVGTTVDYSLTWIGVFDFTGYNTNDLVGQIGHNFTEAGFFPIIGGGEVLFGVAGVPEPSIITLFGLGLIGLGIARRKKHI